MEIQLSVCIPTYNFGAYIAETLTSILSQACPGIEVLVLDSASTDDTPAIVSAFQAQYSCLRYQRDETRGGIDRDMARVVDLAKGRYCWLFSADDLMTEGAIARVLSQIDGQIDGQIDVYVCTHSNETIDMKPFNHRHPVLNLLHDAEFELSNLEQQEQYFALAVTTEAFFSFISGLIVKRSTWMRVPVQENFVGSCWAHVARLFALIRGGLRVQYLYQTLVRRRGENDSFAANGVVKRYGLAINGFQRIAGHFWGSRSFQAMHIRRVLRNEFPLSSMLRAKSICAAAPARESKQELDRMIRTLYSDSFTSNAQRIVYHCFPARLYEPVRKAYKLLRRRGDISAANRT